MVFLGVYLISDHFSQLDIKILSALPLCVNVLVESLVIFLSALVMSLSHLLSVVID